MTDKRSVEAAPVPDAPAVQTAVGPIGIGWSTLPLLVLPPLLWAGNAVAGRMATGRIGPLELNCLRWSGAALLLLPFAWREVIRHRAEIRARWQALLALALFGVGCFNSFQYWALTTSSAMNTTLIGSAGPVFILAVGAVWFGERVSGRQLAGAAVSVAGVAWVMLRGDWTRLIRVVFDPGDFFMLAATLTWSIYTWLLRKSRPALPLRVLLFMQIVLGLGVLIPLAALEIRFRPQPVVWDGTTGLLIAYVVVLPSLVAYYCYDRAVSRVGAQLPVFFNNLTPLFAAAISLLLLGEHPQWFHVLGLMLILAGIHLVSGTRS